MFEEGTIRQQACIPFGFRRGRSFPMVNRKDVRSITMLPGGSYGTLLTVCEMFSRGREGARLRPKMGKVHIHLKAQFTSSRANTITLWRGKVGVEQYPGASCSVGREAMSNHIRVSVRSVYRWWCPQGIINEVGNLKSWTARMRQDTIVLRHTAVTPPCRQVTWGAIVADLELTSWENIVLSKTNSNVMLRPFTSYQCVSEYCP